MDFTSFNEDMLDYQSLGNLKASEWRHLRFKCRQFRMENIVRRYYRRTAVSNVRTIVFVIEFLMLIHIVVLCSLVQNISLVSVVPYAIVMLFTPLIMLPSWKVDRKHYYCINMATSWAMAFILLLADIIGYFFWVEYPLVAAYDHVVLVSVYMFLPIGFLEHGRVCVLGLTISLSYFLYMGWILWDKTMYLVPTLAFYAFYLIFLNALLMFFTRIRKFYGHLAILYRYQLIYQNILFNMAMEEENDLMESIVPFKMSPTLQKDINSRIANEVFSPGNHLGLLYLEPHPEVSILVAHMVNYIHLTNSLEARKMVEVFNELFVNFDLAAHSNQAIKFQGDSYTCVAGIPSYFPEHAACCVDQALDMIHITERLGQRLAININLQIGVHSGAVVAGIIGQTKWQFDIWSQDVYITNRLAESGRPGLVHLSSSTLRLLGNQYFYEEGPEASRTDGLLQRAQLTTYLVKSRNTNIENETSSLEEKPSVTLTPGSLSSNSVHEEIQFMAQREMILQVEHMPVGCRALCRNRKPKHDRGDSLDNEFNTHSYCLFITFRSWKQEWSFHNHPDLMIKYSVLLVFFAGLTLLLMTLATSKTAFDHAIMFGCLGILMFLCLVAVYKKVRLQFSRKPPSILVSRCLFKLSELIEQSILVRIPLVILALLLCYVMASNQTFSCDVAKLEMEIIDADLHNLEVKSLCFLPWVTYAVVLVLSLLFLIIGVPLIFKLLLGLTILGLHLGTIHASYGFAFERSRTTDRNLRADYAHTWYLVAFFILMVVQERQLSYILKAIYFMRVCYDEKRHQTQAKMHTTDIIMANLLPSHVADFFKEHRRNDDLYYDNFSKVAVMFASIENYDVNRAGLRVLHEFICYFDDSLVNYQGKYKIDKIKVMNWTYMAVCGLGNDYGKPQRSVHFDQVENEEASTSHQVLGDDDTAVLVMTKFALDLLRTMQEIRSSLKGNLQIGISHGPVMAGVVGLSKPHYDVWGHTVNMASGMNSTGVLASIHITENTAHALRQLNVRCNYRGQTQVKGVGEVPTYLVALNDHLELIYINEIDEIQENAK